MVDRETTLPDGNGLKENENKKNQALLWNNRM